MNSNIKKTDPHIPPYTYMAQYYDYILRQVDWDGWYKYLRSLMIRFVPDPKLILEIGTGTGKFGARFSADDFNIFGMDISLPMLTEAKKRANRNYKIFCGDVRTFKVTKNFDFIFAVHDTMNYLSTKNDFIKALKNISLIMNPKSVFMFDVTTEYNVRENFHDKKNVLRNNGTSIIWDNNYDSRKKIIFSSMKFKLDTGRTYRETHAQRIYSVDEVKSMLDRAGFHLLAVYHDYKFSPPTKNAVMINFITRLKK